MTRLEDDLRKIAPHRATEPDAATTERVLAAVVGAVEGAPARERPDVVGGGRRRAGRRVLLVLAVILLLVGAVIVAGVTRSHHGSPTAPTTTTPATAPPALAVAITATGNPPQHRLETIDLASATSTAMALAGLSPVDAAWAPDGRTIAVVGSLGQRQGDRYVYEATDVWIADADGTGARRLPNAANALTPVWARDGRSIALGRAVYGGRPTPASAPAVTEAIWLFPATGGDPTRLTNPPDGMVDTPGSFSPDGALLAFTRCGTGGAPGAGPAPLPCEIDVVGVDGTGLRRLATRATDPDWAPDGRAITFATDRDESGTVIAGSDESSFTTDIHRVLPDGSGETAITSTPNRAERQPRASPGGVLIAYTEQRASAFGTRVVVANADGSCPRPLVPTTGTRADWVASPAWRPGSATTEQRQTCP
jgi:Tol biopolymer transport system component